MDWTSYLEPGETVRWEGRPAPRCYTFRNWKHSLVGILLLLLTGFWQVMSFGLARDYNIPLLPMLPGPFMIAALYLSFGHLVLARLEWEKVFFAVTDRRVVVVRGFFRPRILTLPLDRIAYFRVNFFGETLGTIRVDAVCPAATLVLSCIEHPRNLTPLLEAAVARNAGEG